MLLWTIDRTSMLTLVIGLVIATIMLFALAAWVANTMALNVLFGIVLLACGFWLLHVWRGMKKAH